MLTSNTTDSLFSSRLIFLPFSAEAPSDRHAASVLARAVISIVSALRRDRRCGVLGLLITVAGALARLFGHQRHGFVQRQFLALHLVKQLQNLVIGLNTSPVDQAQCREIHQVAHAGKSQVSC